MDEILTHLNNLHYSKASGVEGIHSYLLFVVIINNTRRI